ncbi:extracellular solute-binding protein [Glaciihabitans sp. UYNi722]|uniref:extracellular solute-binding protein n=1 Tax=Glaciihabitans sp. UYNi722 TaxID=3156344 RepID=UPI003399B77E
MDRRQFLAGTILGAASLTLAGCAGTLPPINSSSSSFSRKATGTVEVWCRSATQTGLTAAVAGFNKAHSDLKVNLTPVPDGQYVTKLATAIRGGEPPDVVDIDDINSQLFIFRDSFADLTHVINQLSYVDNLSNGHLHLLARGDKYFGLPYLADNSMLFVNTELFDRADVDLKSSTKDFAGLLEAAGKIRKLGDDTYAWTFPGNSPGALGFVVQPHIWATKSDLIKGDIGSQSGDIVGNDSVQQTLEFYRQLWKDDLVSRASFTDDASRWGGDFRAGTVGMMPTSYGAVVPAASKSMRAKMDAVLLPGPTGGTAFFDGGDNMCIPNGAANAPGGWEFMTYATDLEQQSALPDGGYFPIRADAATDAYRKKYPLAALPLDNLDKGYAPQTLAYNLLYNQAAGPWLAMFRAAVFGSSVASAMKQAQMAYDRILDQAQA